MSAAICIFAGCSDLTMENFRKNKLQPEMFFDFNTTSRVKIDIDYGEYGARTLVSLSSNDPTISDEESTKPLFKAFTDEDGKIMTSFEMPDAIGDSVYLYTSALGTPQLVKAAVSDSTIRYKSVFHRRDQHEGHRLALFRIRRRISPLYTQLVG